MLVGAYGSFANTVLDTEQAGARQRTNPVDRNVRSGYGKLRHRLAVAAGSTAASIWRTILIGTHCDGWLDIEPWGAAPLDRLAERDDFLPPRHSFGLLGMSAVHGCLPRRGIPNEAVRRRGYGALRGGSRGVQVLAVDRCALARLPRDLAGRGTRRPSAWVSSSPALWLTSRPPYARGRHAIHRRVVDILRVIGRCRPGGRSQV